MDAPRRRGRPASDNPKGYTRTVRFTPAEAEQIQRAAASAGVTVAAFIRDAAVRAAQRRNR